VDSAGRLPAACQSAPIGNGRKVFGASARTASITPAELRDQECAIQSGHRLILAGISTSGTEFENLEAL
jgi:hypothetical protein